MNDAESKKEKFSKIALIICICVLVCTSSYLVYILYGYLSQRGIKNHIGDMFDTAGQSGEVLSQVPAPPKNSNQNSDGDPDRNSDPNNGGEGDPNESEWDRERRLLLEAEARGMELYADILEINTDFLGLIEIPGVVTRQPYVLSQDNSEYLSQDFYGKRNPVGTIFLSKYNDRLMMDNNSTIFGHYSDTGAMFAKLTDYKNAATFAQSPVIVLDSLIGKSVWIVFASHVVESDVWWMTPYNDKDDYAAFLEEIKARSLFITDVDVTVNDRIITLSVCDYSYDDMRFIVHARKLRPGELSPEAVTATANSVS